jgi:transcriptional regulator with XRE-family HTH domain
MNYAEFRRLLARSGLTLTAFADLLGMNRKSITNYAANGVVPVHLAVIAALLSSMDDNGLDFRQVVEGVGIQKKKPRGIHRSNMPLAHHTDLK